MTPHAVPSHRLAPPRTPIFNRMADPIEALVQDWKQNPSPAATIALCDALTSSPRGALVQQVGEFATQRHAGDAAVLVSVARMYLQSRRFAEAQTVLVAAGKQAPRDSSIYRWLGEVLLRRGDADRAEKVLERAVQLGAKGTDVELWLERSRVFRPMQAKAGTRAVAAEVAHATGQSIRPPADSMSDGDTEVRVRPPSVAPPPRLPPVSAPPPAPAKLPSFAPPSRSAPPPPLPQIDTAPGSFEPPRYSARPPPKEIAPPASEDIEISDQKPLPTAPPIPNRPLPPFAPPPRRDGAAQNGTTALADDRPMVPHPRDVLDALALAGVYEPDALTSGPAGWDRAAPGPKRKGIPTLIAGMLLFVGASVGVYYFYRDKRAKEHVQAEALLGSVEAQLHAGRPDALPDAEKQLARAFQLESRSPRAALDWARERAMAGVIKSGEDVAFEDAMARAKDVGVPEDKYAFARVASFLFQGDTAGAAAVLPRWDGPAGGDAWYQLVAGATLERAGDGRARDRYTTASKLDGDLVVARIALARATAIEGNASDAMRLAKELRTAMPDRAEPVALVALAWGRDPKRDPASAPPEVEELAKRGDELPAGLRFVPHAVAALRALDRRSTDDARAEVQQGLAVANSPGAAVWLGTIALPLGDEGLARKAALAALQLSAAYEPARALAARVALLGARLDEALKATEDLDPGSPDVVVVRAACAYERVDTDGFARALEGLPPEARKLPFLSALGVAYDGLTGKLQLDGAKVVAMAGDEAPWSDLVAMDAALDGGDLASADKIAASWGAGAQSQPLRALRLGRLARYEGRLDSADSMTQTALDHGTVTPRVLWERAYFLVARNRAGEVAPLLARYPLVLGPLAAWLGAFATASGGSAELARGKTASIDPPPSAAPLGARVVAAAALAAMKDKRRGTDYVRDVLKTGSLHPDLVAAALSLGLRKVDHGRRRPTYQ